VILGFSPGSVLRGNGKRSVGRDQKRRNSGWGTGTPRGGIARAETTIRKEIAEGTYRGRSLVINARRMNMGGKCNIWRGTGLNEIAAGLGIKTKKVTDLGSQCARDKKRKKRDVQNGIAVWFGGVTGKIQGICKMVSQVDLLGGGRCNFYQSGLIEAGARCVDRDDLKQLSCSAGGDCLGRGGVESLRIPVKVGCLWKLRVTPSGEYGEKRSVNPFWGRVGNGEEHFDLR